MKNKKHQERLKNEKVHAKYVESYIGQIWGVVFIIIFEPDKLYF